jgi:hypothetical protein
MGLGDVVSSFAAPDASNVDAFGFPVDPNAPPPPVPAPLTPAQAQAPASFAPAPISGMPPGPPVAQPQAGPPVSPLPPGPQSRPVGVGAYPGGAGAPAAPAAGVAPSSGLSTNDWLKLAAQRGSVKPGFAPTSRTSEGPAYSPETIAATGQELGANREQAEAQLGYESAQGGAQAKADKILALYDQADALSQQNRQNAIASQLGAERDHLKSLITEANAAKIDPKKYFRDMSTGSRIMTGVMMALQGFAHGLGRGADPLAWLNTQIEQNIDAQKADLENKRQGVNDAANLYAINRQALGDDDRAKMATALAQRQAIAAQLKAYVADVTAPQAGRLRAAQLAQGLAQQNAATLRAMDEKTKQIVTERYQAPSTTGEGDILQQVKRAQEIKAGIQALEGSDLPTQEKQAQIAKLQQELGGGGRGAEEISKALEGAGVPAGEAALAEADKLMAQGAADSSVTTLGLPRQVAVGGALGGFAAGADARELDRVLSSLAEAQAHANGQRGTEAIEYNKRIMRGNGTREDIQRGIELVRRSLAARRAAIEAGFAPGAGASVAQRRAEAGTTAPPGFQSEEEQ